MLFALAEDAAAADGIATTVLLCPEAQASLQTSEPGVLTGADISINVRATAPDSLVDQLRAITRDYDVVLPVAPECDQLLQNVSVILEATDCRTLLPTTAMIDICGDKLKTWRSYSTVVPMLSCEKPKPGEESLAQEWVIKPRFGAGCDGVTRCCSVAACPDDFIFQPWIDAQSYSIGVVSDGARQWQLPVASQNIDWQAGVPQYTGGSIPARLDQSISREMASIVDLILQKSEPFAGYMGFDFLVRSSDSKVFLNEINPRVCTSYIGYRRILSNNPIELMLGRELTPELSVQDTFVSFDSFHTACSLAR